MLQDIKSYFIAATGRDPLPNRHWQRGRRQPWLNLVLSAKSVGKLRFICIYEEEGSRINCVPLPPSHCSLHLIGERKITWHLPTRHRCPMVHARSKHFRFSYISMNSIRPGVQLLGLWSFFYYFNANMTQFSVYSLYNLVVTVFYI